MRMNRIILRRISPYHGDRVSDSYGYLPFAVCISDFSIP